MRVQLSAYGSRGDVEPMAGLAVRLRALGAVTEKLGIRYVYASFQPVSVPSPHHPPSPLPGRPFPPEVTHRASVGLPPVDNVRDHVFTDHPWLAADPTLSDRRVLSAALRTALTPETRARATAVAGAIRTDGATVAAALLFDAVGRERPPVSA